MYLKNLGADPPTNSCLKSGNILITGPVGEIIHNDHPGLPGTCLLMDFVFTVLRHFLPPMSAGSEITMENACVNIYIYAVHMDIYTIYIIYKENMYVYIYIYCRYVH